MPSQLGKYTLMRTLGSGANSKVKLALDKSTGEYYAVKIMKKGDPRLDQKFLELVLTEVKTMQQLKHLNIVNLMEYNEQGVVEKSQGKKYEVIYIVIELAKGGELFDYVATTGRFSDKISRFYFKQLLDGLDYVHNKGVTHRDLKPENVLFDDSFNLKIADFGFAAPIEGKDGSGTLKTKLGTESYMAPEIHMKKPYSGSSVDLFASSIILFIMITQHPPFTRAEPSDPFYRLLCANRSDLFWKAHSRNKPDGFFTDDFKNLITSMFSFDPAHRLSLNDIQQHNWMKSGETATLEEIQVEFQQRKKTIEEDAEQKRLQKEQERQQRQGEIATRQKYRGANRGVGDEEEKKALEEYVRMVHKNTEFFSTTDPNTLYEILEQFAEDAKLTLNSVKNKYKGKLIVPLDDGDEKLEINCQILKVDKDKYCFEFSKRSGHDSFHFFEKFNQIKEYFGEFVNAYY